MGFFFQKKLEKIEFSGLRPAKEKVNTFKCYARRGIE